jgi:protein SCO1/2
MKSSNLKYILLLGLAFVLGYGIYTANNLYKDYTELPILGQTLKDEAGNLIYHTIDTFTTINQNGEIISQQSMKGKIHVANFFFTSCPVICPQMTLNLKTVQESVNIPDFEFISFSIDPKRDSIQKMKQFAEKFEVNESNWHFVRAEKEVIYKLVRNSYFLLAVEGSSEKNDFIHSEQVALVDKDLRIRGFYDAMDEEGITQLKKDIKKLNKSYN